MKNSKAGGKREKDAIAQQLLEDESFVDRLHEKIRARDEARSAQTARTLAEAAMAGAKMIRENMAG